MNISVIIAAAGSGRRLGKEKNKVLLDFNGKPLLAYSLLLFEQFAEISEVVIVAAAGEEGQCENIAQTYCKKNPYKVVVGGKERLDSVRRGLGKVAAASDYVLVHDGARPFLDATTLTRLLTADFTDGAILALPVKETVKSVASAVIIKTIPREQLYTAQTPQLFKKKVLLTAYEQAESKGLFATDDAAVVENWGGKITIVQGSEANIKITTLEDWKMAEAREEYHSMRIGSGYDVHGFTPNRSLVLGGVTIPHSKGLEGHSDADVLTHALIDAILGAMAKGDIGQHFPDNDSRYKDISSLKLLKEVCTLMASSGYQLINADITVMAEKPKLAPHIMAIRESLGSVMGLEIDCLSVKATTTEKLGFVGREEGIAAQATVLLK